MLRESARRAIIANLELRGPLARRELKVRAAKDRKHAPFHNEILDGLVNAGVVNFRQTAQMPDGANRGVFSLAKTVEG